MKQIPNIEETHKPLLAIEQMLQKDRQDIYTSLVAAVEGKKEDGDTPFGTQELHETELAYNQALTDTLTIINSIFKE